MFAHKPEGRGRYQNERKLIKVQRVVDQNMKLDEALEYSETKLFLVIFITKYTTLLV